jgi:lysophospholipase L1-like esterase
VIITALGDSLSVGYNNDRAGAFVTDPNGSYPAVLAKMLGANKLVLSAATGDTIGSVDLSVIPLATDLLILNIGTNDLWYVAQGDTTLEVILEAWDAIYSGAILRAPNALTVVIGLRDNSWMRPNLYPSLRDLVPAFNRHIFAQKDIVPVSLDSRPGAYEFKYFPDSIHPSTEGVQWIAQAVIEALACRAITGP